MRRHGVFEVGYVFHGNYRVVRVLGRGGMGTVLEVEHTRLPRRLALKVMTSPVSAASEDMLRFRREAETLASLNHPNLVVVFDWNVTDDEHLPYLVMELLTGEDLAQVLKRSGALPQQVAISILAQAITALEVVHSHGIVHRDLKPANLFVCKNGVIPHFIKVLDFGIAKNCQASSALVTNNLVLMGTPAYMAPEQARGDLGPVGPRTDQFALGLVLYEMLTGCPAFYRPREPAMTTLFRVMHEEPQPLPDAAMNAAVMRALRKHPDERYQSLPEFLRAVLGAASVPVEAIEVPERTEKVGVRSFVAAASPSEAAGAERSEAGRARPEPSEKLALPSRVPRADPSLVAPLPASAPLPAVPVVSGPTAFPASMRGPVTDRSGPRSGVQRQSGARIVPGGTAAGQSLPAIAPLKSHWRLALAVLPVLALGIAARHPLDGLDWLRSLRQPNVKLADGPLPPLQPQAGLSDAGLSPDGSVVVDMAPPSEPPPDMTPARTPTVVEPAVIRVSPRAAGPKLARPRYGLRLGGIERGHPERDAIWSCIEKSLNREDRVMLAKAAALEVCWTSKRGWNVVTSVWIHNERTRDSLEPCLNASSVLPTTGSMCFVVKAEEER